MIEKHELKPGVKVQGQPDAPVMRVIETIVEANKVVLDIPVYGKKVLRLDVILRTCNIVSQ